MTQAARGGAPDLLPAVARLQPAGGFAGSSGAVAAGAAACSSATCGRTGETAACAVPQRHGCHVTEHKLPAAVPPAWQPAPPRVV